MEFSSSIQEAMIGPLCAKATYGKLYPELLDDPMAAEIVSKIDYNYSKIQNYNEEWCALGFLVRARSFDIALKKYIEANPEATIVNIGASLDTTFFRVDNGRIKWYDLDLPNSIELRRS